MLHLLYNKYRKYKICSFTNRFCFFIGATTLVEILFLFLFSDGILKPKLYFKKLFHRFEKDVSFTGKLMTEKAIFDDFIGNVDYSINYENSKY